MLEGDTYGWRRREESLERSLLLTYSRVGKLNTYLHTIYVNPHFQLSFHPYTQSISALSRQPANQASKEVSSKQERYLI
jgi:hypothetical protein